MAIGGFSERLALLITADGSGAIRELEGVGRTADRELGRAGQASRNWSATFTRSGAMLVGGAAVAAVGLGKLASSASDVEEAQNKVNVVFGDGADEVNAFAEGAAESAGLSKAAALDAAGGFGAMFDALGLSKDASAEMSIALTQLAGDMGSFNNVDPTEMLEKLRSGISGEVEPLRRFGVNLSAAAVNAKAMELGLADASGEVSEAAKVQARYQIILEQTSLQQGDFARTSDSMANQQRIAAAEFENLKASIGQGVLPVANELLGGLNKIVGVFNDLSPATQEWIGKIGAGVTVVAALTGGALLAVGQLIKMKQSLDAIKATRFATTFTTLAPAAGILGGITAGAWLLTDAFGSWGEPIEETVAKLHELEGVELTKVAQDFVDWEEELKGVGKVLDSNGVKLKAFEKLAEADAEAAQKLRDEAKKLGEDTTELDKILVGVNDELAKNERQLDSGLVAAAAAAGGQRQLGDQTDDTTGKVDDQTRAVTKLNDKLQAHIDKVLEAAGDQISFERAMDRAEDAARDLDDRLGDVNTSTEDLEDSTWDAKEAILDIGPAAVAQWEAVTGKTATAKQQTDIMRFALLDFQNTLAPGSPLRAYIDELAASLDNAMRPRSTTLHFTATGDRPAGIVGGGFILQSGGPVPGARGEPVVGTAHGGEFILSADVVDKIKKGRPTIGADATGGMAGMAGGGTVINVGNVTLPNVTDPQQFVDGLVKWYRANGPIPVGTAA